MKTKKTKVPYSTDYYYNGREYEDGRPKGKAQTGEWICPGHGLSTDGAVGIACGVVFGLSALIFVWTAVKWIQARK